jgi:uncharacterized protein
MTAAPIHLGGHRLLLDPLGAAIWPEAGVMAVADLHLEKGSAAARRGSLLPPLDTGATLDRLALLLRRHRPETVVALGDSFHDVHGPARMAGGELARLRAMADAHRFIWVLGNHDPAPPDGVPGIALAAWERDGLIFRHQAVPGAEGELCGHHHPKASVETRAGRITRPCFVADSRRLMLPALGAYTGGLCLTNPAIARLFPRGGRAFLLGAGRVFSFTLAQVGGMAAPP